MTADQVNAEVDAFVRCKWTVHHVVDVQGTPDNVTSFSNNDEAKIEFSSRGNLLHEICHVIIEKEALNGKIEECMKDAVCDAYKFLKMQENNLNTYSRDDNDWFNKITQFKCQGIQEILSASCDKPHDIIYGIPASRILRCFDTLDNLREQIILGIKAEGIIDPDINLPETLQYCWPLWKEMMDNKKSEDSKGLIKKQIENKVLESLGNRSGSSPKYKRIL